MSYVRKYKAPRDSDEWFDSDEIMHIINSIKKYEEREQFKHEIIIAIPLAIIIVIVLSLLGK
jgi:hypothetical protein